MNVIGVYGPQDYAVVTITMRYSMASLAHQHTIRFANHMFVLRGREGREGERVVAKRVFISLSKRSQEIIEKSKMRTNVITKQLSHQINGKLMAHQLWTINTCRQQVWPFIRPSD